MAKAERLHSLNRAKLVHDLTILVGYRTVTGQPEGFTEAMDFIDRQVSPRAHLELLPNHGEPILIASNIQTRSPDVLYLVHLDVVAAKQEQFSMKVRNDIAYGRGVSDMKYSIPVGYSLLNDLINQNSKLSFMIAVTSDEERGGFNGAGWLADKYQLTPKLLIVPDGGDGFKLVNKSKGVCQLRVSREGSPAHSSMPWLGESALEPIVKLATQLLAKYEAGNKQEGWHTTMNLGTLHGGTLVNQVAPNAQLGIDFRFPPEDASVESLTAEVKSLAAQIDSKLQVEVTATGIATFTDPTHPALQLFMQVLSKRIGQAITVRGEHGAYDGRHFNKYGVPYIMTKPAGGDIHGDNEHISLESVMIFYEALLTFLSQYEKLNLTS